MIAFGHQLKEFLEEVLTERQFELLGKLDSIRGKTLSTAARELDIPQSTVKEILRKFDGSLIKQENGKPIELTETGDLIFNVTSKPPEQNRKLTTKVGIVGGLGPETTSEFYLGLVKESKEKTGVYPRVTVDNVSFPTGLEKKIILNSKAEEKMLTNLKRSIKSLNEANVNFIVIPCNTVHLFLEELREVSQAPIINLIEEVKQKVEKKSYGKVGLLATKTTIKNELYQNALRDKKVILPNPKNQESLSCIIFRVLEGKSNEKDKAKIVEMIENLSEKGAECVILGCTDLQLLIDPRGLEVEVIDSLNVLLKTTVRKITRDYSLKVE